MLTKLRNYEPETHRAMTGPIDEGADEYKSICAELDHTERRAIEIAVGTLEPYQRKSPRSAPRLPDRTPRGMALSGLLCSMHPSALKRPRLSQEWPRRVWPLGW